MEVSIIKSYVMGSVMGCFKSKEVRGVEVVANLQRYSLPTPTPKPVTIPEDVNPVSLQAQIKAIMEQERAEGSATRALFNVLSANGTCDVTEEQFVSIMTEVWEVKVMVVPSVIASGEVD